MNSSANGSAVHAGSMMSVVHEPARITTLVKELQASRERTQQLEKDVEATMNTMNSANVERIKKLSEELVEHGNELKLLEEENTELKARVAELEAAAQARPKGPNDSLNESVFGEEMANRLNTILEQEATIAEMRKQMASMAGEKTAAEKQVEQLQAQVKQVTDTAANEMQELKAAHAQELEHVRARAKDTLQLSRSQMQSEIDALRMRPPNVTSRQEAVAQTDSSSLTMTNSDHMQKEREALIESLELTNQVNDSLTASIDALEARLAQMVCVNEHVTQACCLVRSRVSELQMSNQPITQEHLLELQRIMMDVDTRAMRPGGAKQYSNLEDRMLRMSSNLSINWDQGHVAGARGISPHYEEMVDHMENEALKQRLRQDSTMSINSMVTTLMRKPSLDSVGWDFHREQRDTGTPWSAYETIDEHSGVRIKTQSSLRARSQRGSERGSERGSTRRRREVRQHSETAGNFSSGSIHGLKKGAAKSSAGAQQQAGETASPTEPLAVSPALGSPPGITASARFGSQAETPPTIVASSSNEEASNGSRRTSTVEFLPTSAPPPLDKSNVVKPMPRPAPRPRLNSAPFNIRKGSVGKLTVEHLTEDQLKYRSLPPGMRLAPHMAGVDGKFPFKSDDKSDDNNDDDDDEPPQRPPKPANLRTSISSTEGHPQQQPQLKNKHQGQEQLPQLQHVQQTEARRQSAGNVNRKQKLLNGTHKTVL